MSSKAQSNAKTTATPAPASAIFQVRPFAAEQTQEHAAPNHANAALPGHRFAAIDCQPRTPLPLIVQPKLRLGPANDQYEQQADRIAAQVVGGRNTPSTQAGLRQPLVQRVASAPSAGIAVTPGVEAGIHAARGSGQPLPAAVRSQMETAIGADFSSVRVHNDSRANALNQAVQARAFTTGRDVFFGRGEYQPGSNAGRRVLAHELAHVVQQQTQVRVIQRLTLGDLRVLNKNDKTLYEGIIINQKEKEFRKFIQEKITQDEGINLIKNICEQINAKYKKEKNEELAEAMTYIQNSLKYFVKDTKNEGTISKNINSINETLEKFSKLKGDYDKMKENEQKKRTEQEKEKKTQDDIKEKKKKTANGDWNEIQNDPGGQPIPGQESHGAKLVKLLVGGFVTKAAPHRCFLSRYEKDNAGNREGNRFGLSCRLPPGKDIITPGKPLVVHLHCNGDGVVLYASIKYESSEHVVGDALAIESFWRPTLRSEGINGANVNAKVRQFN
ncbi:MAG: DUF4157 domain-containing protein [Roseiflexaceae bacterium]|nr:DUF4157 domain-containing protein [Roseiflexaceae bacterium]